MVGMWCREQHANLTMVKNKYIKQNWITAENVIITRTVREVVKIMGKKQYRKRDKFEESEL